MTQYVSAHATHRSAICSPRLDASSNLPLQPDCQLRDAGASLTNSTDGGSGSQNPIIETREKIAAAVRGTKRPARSAEWCARLGAANRGKKRTPEQNEKHAAKLRGRPLSEAHVKALRAAKEKQKLEGRTAISEAQKTKLSIAARRQWERQARPLLDVTTGIVYRTQAEAAVAIGVTQSAIGKAAHGKIPRVAGHHVQFLDECPNAKING